MNNCNSELIIIFLEYFIVVSLMVTADQDLGGEMHNVFLCGLPMFHVFGPLLLCIHTS